MRFIVSNGGRYNGCGDLFYSLPDKEAEENAAERLRSLFVKHCGDITPEIEAEIEALKERGKAVETLILYEISEFSYIQDYCTTLLGPEGGLQLIQRLGISGFSTKFVGNYCSVSSEMCITELKEKKDFTFNFVIDGQVRKHIPALLSVKLGKTGDISGEYRRITMIDKDDFKQPTGFWSDDNKYITERVGGDKLLREARQIAYDKCFNRENISFNEAEKLILREDVYRLLTEKGVEKTDALRIAKGLQGKEQKEKDMEMLRELGLPERTLRLIGGIDNRWCLVSCVARIYQSGDYYVKHSEDDEFPF